MGHPVAWVRIKNPHLLAKDARRMEHPLLLLLLLLFLFLNRDLTLDNGCNILYIQVCTERNVMAELTGVQKQYILHWGEMGTRWGINRTVAQIHALLFLSPKALPAEEIAETLSVARSNVSTSIRGLETWGIVRAVHVWGIGGNIMNR